MLNNLKSRLPLIPGYNFNLNPGQTRFHKPHHFDFHNAVPMHTDRDPPGTIGDQPLSYQQRRRIQCGVLPQGEGPATPAWVAFDKQVLRFCGYFQEPVHDSRVEDFRVRHCKVLFFLEDETVRVDEPRCTNSGIPQGTLIRRHRMRRAPPFDDEYFCIEDFNVGVDVHMYGRRIKLISCDTFTRNFLQKLGIPVGEDSPPPEDPFSTHRAKLDERMQPLKPSFRVDTLGQFLRHDGHVLRFWGYWDDPAVPGDPVRELVIHYFLSDDTIEIREVVQPNSGRDTFPVFVKKDRLPKTVPPVGWPGDNTKIINLNVLNQLPLQDRAAQSAFVADKYYHDKDLMIGCWINAWGRKILLTDCDNFTKEYYRQKYGVVDFTPGEIPDRRAPPFGPREVPPYNGFGSEEDSRANCLHVIPKAPTKEPHLFYLKDRQGWESNVLRFHCKMVAEHPVNVDRRFIISYFLSDDTITVYEPTVRNSGLAGGAFLHRARVERPGQDIMGSRPRDYYNIYDFYVGAVVDFNGYKFKVLTADAYTFSYMEKRCHEFPFANWRGILERVLKCLGDTSLFDMAKVFFQEDTDSSGRTTYGRFREVVLCCTKNALIEHEMMTIGRKFAAPKADRNLTSHTLAEIAQTELRKNLFNGFDVFLQCLQNYDKENTGLVPRHVLRNITRGQPIPLVPDLQDRLIDALPASDVNPDCVDYREFIKSLNWQECPAGVAAPFEYKPYLRKPQSPIVVGVFQIMYTDFLQALGYDEKLVPPITGRKTDVYQFHGPKRDCMYGGQNLFKHPKEETEVPGSVIPEHVRLEPDCRDIQQEEIPVKGISNPGAPEGDGKPDQCLPPRSSDILAACKTDSCTY